MEFAGQMVQIRKEFYMEELKQIIEKVRTMYRYNKKLESILANPASIRIVEENGDLKPMSIIFDNYDKDIIAITSKSIKYFDCKQNEWEILAEFNDFEELLSM